MARKQRFAVGQRVSDPMHGAGTISNLNGVYDAVRDAKYVTVQFDSGVVYATHRARLTPIAAPEPAPDIVEYLERRSLYGMAPGDAPYRADQPEPAPDPDFPRWPCRLCQPWAAGDDDSLCDTCEGKPAPDPAPDVTQEVERVAQMVRDRMACEKRNGHEWGHVGTDPIERCVHCGAWKPDPAPIYPYQSDPDYGVSVGYGSDGKATSVRYFGNAPDGLRDWEKPDPEPGGEFARLLREARTSLLTVAVALVRGKVHFAEDYPDDGNLYPPSTEEAFCQMTADQILTIERRIGATLQARAARAEEADDGG